MSISIVMPVRNAQDTLADCLASILAQTHTDFELIAVDDASRDGTRALLVDAARRDARVRVLDNPSPGLVNALNLGLEAARFDLIARMDADDLMDPRRLQFQYAAFALDATVAVVGSCVSIFEHLSTAQGLREYVRWQNLCQSPRQIADNIYVEAPFAHPSVMFRRAPVLAIGAYRQGLFPEDYDLWLRLAHAGYVMRKLPDALLQWRDSPQRVSRTDPRYSRAAFDRLRAKYLARDERVRGAPDGVCFWGAGRRTRQRVAHLQRLGIRPRLWIDIDPRKIGNIIDDARVVAPSALADLANPFVLSYVTNHGARERICNALDAMGLVCGRDYLCVG